MPPVTLPLCHRQRRDEGLPALSFGDGVIRYVAYRNKRRFVALSGIFDGYLTNFSSKTRGNLKRQVKYFTLSAGELDFRYYVADAMPEFCRLASMVSAASYQSKIGCGLPPSEEILADSDAIGFLLMHKNGPAAYALCMRQGDALIYSTIGYDPQYKDLSPGTVLLYLILQRLFAEQRFRIFDFVVVGDYGYKTMFSTGSLDYARVLWFPWSLKNFALVGLHYLSRRLWDLVSAFKRKTSHAKRS